MALIPVIVTTRYRAVFFGYIRNDVVDKMENPGFLLENINGSTVAVPLQCPNEIKLYNARNAMYWDGSQGGFLGLAKLGPNEDSHISAEAPWMVLKKVTAVIGVTPEAEKKWNDTPDYMGKEEGIEDEK